jgi:Zn-finger nucleic acid-binding protein
MKPTTLLSPCFAPEKKIYLQAVHVQGVELDICPLTGGIWFDRFEIQKFDEAHEDLTELLAAIPKNPIKAEVLTSRKSPKHPQAVMQQQPYGPKGMNGALIIDKCPMCAGIWLDYAEILKIRELYPTAEDKKKAVDAFVGDSFDVKSIPQKHSALGLSRVLLKLTD